MMDPLGYNYNEWVTWQIYKLRAPHCKALWLSILVRWCSCMEQAIWGSKLVKISDHSKFNGSRASDTTPAHHRHHATIVRHRPFVTCEVIPSSRSLLIIATQHTERSSDYEIIFVIFHLYYNVKQTNKQCLSLHTFFLIRVNQTLLPRSLSGPLAIPLSPGLRMLKSNFVTDSSTIPN